MYVGGIEITFREALVSIIIFLVMGAIGISIDTRITDHFIENNSKYQKAVKIRDKDTLDYLISTKAGNSLVEGKVKASGTVSFKEINGEYSYVEKIKEVYTMHTRTVCETVGSGKIQHEVCHLETYWTWDRAGSEPKYAKEMSIYGHKLDTRYALEEISSSRLNLSKNINDQYKQKKDGNCIYESGHVRYYYKYIPKSFKGVIYTNFAKKAKSFKNYSLERATIKELVEKEKESINFGGIAFKIFWFALIVFVIYEYVAQDNDYLDN